MESVMDTFEKLALERFPFQSVYTLAASVTQAQLGLSWQDREWTPDLERVDQVLLEILTT